MQFLRWQHTIPDFSKFILLLELDRTIQHKTLRSRPAAKRSFFVLLDPWVIEVILNKFCFWQIPIWITLLGWHGGGQWRVRVSRSIQIVFSPSLFFVGIRLETRALSHSEQRNLSELFSSSSFRLLLPLFTDEAKPFILTEFFGKTISKRKVIHYLESLNTNNNVRITRFTSTLEALRGTRHGYSLSSSSLTHTHDMKWASFSIPPPFFLSFLRSHLSWGIFHKK